MKFYGTQNLIASKRVLKTDERGAALVEFSVSLPVYLIVMIAIAALVRVSFINLTMQHVVTEIARKQSIGLFKNDADPIATLKGELIQVAAGFGVEIDPNGISACSISQSVDCPPAPGISDPNTPINLPSDWIYIEVTQPISALYFTWRGTLQASAIVRNEPF